MCLSHIEPGGTTVDQCQPIVRIWNTRLPGQCLSFKEPRCANAAACINLCLGDLVLPMLKIRFGLPLGQKIDANSHSFCESYTARPTGLTGAPTIMDDQRPAFSHRIWRAEQYQGVVVPICFYHASSFLIQRLRQALCRSFLHCRLGGARDEAMLCSI